MPTHNLQSDSSRTHLAVGWCTTSHEVPGIECAVRPSTTQADTISIGKHGSPACPICQEDFAPGSFVETTRCGHTFCYECLTSWQNMGHKQCPMCRTLMTQLPQGHLIHAVPSSNAVGYVRLMRSIFMPSLHHHKNIEKCQEFRITAGTWFYASWSDNDYDPHGCEVVSDGKVEYMDNEIDGTLVKGANNHAQQYSAASMLDMRPRKSRTKNRR